MARTFIVWRLPAVLRLLRLNHFALIKINMLESVRIRFIVTLRFCWKSLYHVLYTLQMMNGNDREAVMRSHTDLAEAAANGSRAMVELLLDDGVQIDTPGRDGTTPLCAAALWGNDVMVTYLLDKGAEVSAQNEGTGWTALHAASFQEHGKVVRLLLAYQADPRIMDAEGRRAVDYASISEAIWPFFSGLDPCFTTLSMAFLSQLNLASSSPRVR